MEPYGTETTVHGFSTWITKLEIVTLGVAEDAYKIMRNTAFDDAANEKGIVSVCSAVCEKDATIKSLEKPSNDDRKPNPPVAVSAKLTST